ncbi:MAG: Uma2 family endonuclease [Abditibacteriales bacterium]|nr:Uma2 family endonuclease [Abditibacteriales bacterium]MCS6861610.1 Uma2 family endonuclease [Abditibacteriales bacterium]MDW8367806.1 Uma2 family endonuclease [Abditibacteriales bacterium]
MMAMQVPTREKREVYYPESDGKPLAETDIHRDQIIDLVVTLGHFFRDQSEVYVSGNICLYYEEDNPSKYVAPDVLVVKGVAKGRRHTYKVWEEGKPPDVVIEVTSKQTEDEDVFFKRNLYEQVLKVPEYFTFDPTGDYLDPPLQGYRWAKGRYVRLKETGGRLRSNELGLALGVEGGWLYLYDWLTGEKLLTPAEAYAAYQQAEAELEREVAARQQAEVALQQAQAEIERLRAELEALRGKRA